MPAWLSLSYLWPFLVGGALGWYHGRLSSRVRRLEKRLFAATCRCGICAAEPWSARCAMCFDDLGVLNLQTPDMQRKAAP